MAMQVYFYYIFLKKLNMRMKICLHCKIKY